MSYVDRFHWLEGDLRDVGPAELEFGPPKVLIDRMLAESCDVFDHRDKDERIDRLIVRRPGENIPHPIQDLEEPDDPVELDDDAMAHREIGAPSEKWDLVRWCEWRRKPDGEWIRVEKSAPWFPSRRDCRPKGYMSVLEKLVRAGRLQRRALYMAVNQGFKDKKLTRAQAKRLWELEKIQQFLDK